jgi:hypothetical protein
LLVYVSCCAFRRGAATLPGRRSVNRANGAAGGQSFDQFADAVQAFLDEQGKAY